MKAVCAKDTEANLAAFAKKGGWESYETDWRALVARDDIDLVSCAAPGNLHKEIVVEAARYGKHILCEKPLALNVKQAEAMLAAAQKNKVVHMVCHNYRRVPAIALARRMIGEGALGEVHHFRARYAQDWLVDPEYPLKWRLEKNVSGSGAHGDINVHIIDLARYLVGEFKEVCGLMHTFTKERPLPGAGGKGLGQAAKAVEKKGKVTVDDAALFIGRFANGALASLEATRCAAGRKNHLTLEINGAKGSLFFDLEDMNRLKFYETASPADRQGFRDILVTQPEGAHPYVNHYWRNGQLLGYEHTFIHTVADFINACVEGKPVHPTFEDGLKNQQVLEAVELSVKKGQWAKV